ncbi:MAG: 50S ribosomal protein L13 [Candidatus Margulisbacteria bacterium]|nr:50S ribosomal protein L13 [Candidatus Margulisiibacteriota bacterium]
MKEQKSFYAKPTDINPGWHHIDADSLILGRLATTVASILRGKHKPTYTPSVDMGDFVVVTNAEKVNLTGKKKEQKMYHRHSGYPGGLTSIAFEDQIKKDATRVIMAAVKGMLPHNRLGRQMLKKLKVYNGASHPHEAQNPLALKIS